KNPTQDSLGKLKAEAATKPEPVRSMVSYVVNRNWALMMQASYSHVNTVWQQEVLPTCNTILADRYPFSPGSKEEVSLQDMGDLFRRAGIIEKFKKDNRGACVTVKGRALTANVIKDASMGFSGAALSQFATARVIRAAFFGPAGTTAEAKFTVEPTFLD